MKYIDILLYITIVLTIIFICISITLTTFLHMYSNYINNKNKKINPLGEFTREVLKAINLTINFNIYKWKLLRIHQLYRLLLYKYLC